MRETYLIGIAGGSGSGKTTFIQKIRELFSEEELCVISQDNYYKKRENQIEDELGVRNFDLPSSIFLDDYLADIQKLLRKKKVVREEYTFNNKEAIENTIELLPAPIIIAEGLFVFSDIKLKAIYDLKLMIDATDDKKIIRRIKRDRIERNYPLEDVLYRYEHHVVPAYNEFITPHKKDADMIINNNVSFDNALEVLSSFIRVKIEKIRGVKKKTLKTDKIIKT